MMRDDRTSIRPLLNQGVGCGVNACLARRFIRQPRGPFLGLRSVNGWRRECRLAGIQDDLVRPFARRFDPDFRAVDDLRPIGKAVCGLRQDRAGYQQKDNECAFASGVLRTAVI
jgi:hypothetical protein